MAVTVTKTRQIFWAGMLDTRIQQLRIPLGGDNCKTPMYLK